MTDHDPIPDPARPGCAAAQAALQRLLDGEPAWDTPAAAAHRDGCRPCREEFALAGLLRRSPTDVVVPAALTDRVVAAAVRSHRRHRRYRYAGAGLALAASVVVLILALRPPAREPDPAPLPGPVVQGPITPEPGPPPRPLGESVAEARDALTALTRRTATETRDQSAWLVPMPRMPEPADPSEGLEPLADARTGAARSVEPLRDSARRAFNLFLRAADPPDRPN